MCNVCRSLQYNPASQGTAGVTFKAIIIILRHLGSATLQIAHAISSLEAVKVVDGSLRLGQGSPGFLCLAARNPRSPFGFVKQWHPCTEMWRGQEWKGSVSYATDNPNLRWLERERTKRTPFLMCRGSNFEDLELPYAIGLVSPRGRRSASLEGLHLMDWLRAVPAAALRCSSCPR